MRYLFICSLALALASCNGNTEEQKIPDIPRSEIAGCNCPATFTDNIDIQLAAAYPLKLCTNGASLDPGTYLKEFLLADCYKDTILARSSSASSYKFWQENDTLHAIVARELTRDDGNTDLTDVARYDYYTNRATRTLARDKKVLFRSPSISMERRQEIAKMLENGSFYKIPQPEQEIVINDLFYCAASHDIKGQETFDMIIGNKLHGASATFYNDRKELIEILKPQE